MQHSVGFFQIILIGSSRDLKGSEGLKVRQSWNKHTNLVSKIIYEKVQKTFIHKIWNETI